MGNIYLWSTTDVIKISEEINDDIVKISNIDNHVFLLTNTNNLYHGCVENIDNILQLNLIKRNELKITDLQCSEEHVYVVDVDGKVFKLTEDLKICNEFILTEEPKCCSHGHCSAKKNLKVRNIAIGKFGILFLTACGQLWACGSMPQIGINSKEPKKVIFFEGRTTYSIAVGYDFAIALVCKQVKTDDTDSDECEEDVFVSTCPRCVSSTRLSTPSSHNSLSDMCPLGLSMVEKSSTTSLPSSSKETESSDSETTRKLIEENNSANCDKSEKNIIFRNTEAAKEFLTRQFSWVSVGEEYLAECTERPTRIIKENVSNMANLVYEGVKTVGDKVVTLSRHVSGSSDNNEPADSSDLIHDSAASSKDDFLLSSSQGTSERECLEHGLQERSNGLFKCGSLLLNTEVWTWGNIHHGQLGIGDTIRRDKPMLISKLSNVGVRRVHAASFHAAALTVDGRCFLWGRNDHHQVSADCNSNVSAPKLFVTAAGDRAGAVSCGSSHTAILTNGGQLLYLGKAPGAPAGRAVPLLAPGPAPPDGPTGLELRPLARRSTRRLCSSSVYTCLSAGADPDNPLLEDVALEQIFLEELVTAQAALIKLLQKKYSITSDSNIYEMLYRSYNEISYITALNLSSLVDYCSGLAADADLVMLKHAEEHLFIYRKYLKVICDMVSLGGFGYISQIIELPQALYKALPQPPSKRDKRAPENLIHWVFTHPLQRVSIYSLIAQKLLRMRPVSDGRLHDLKSRWDALFHEQEVRQNEAVATRRFWENSGKCVELLRSPGRRLLRESHGSPLFLQNAGRFSSHWFILLSDIFIHMNGASSSTHDLITTWVEPQHNADNQQHVLLLTMPEESMALYTTEPEHRADWLHSLQGAIKASLGKAGLHQPPQLRTASYTFSRHPSYKDAKYTGHWLNGKMHRSGKLEWPDGRLYVGQFHNNQMNGYGRLENPSVGIYEGQWKDNQQNGKGIMRYVSGDVHEGYFKDGLPHGHGVRKQGHFMASVASMYIGEWVAGLKHGYGVMDDIVTGEKYLGNWLDNKKHGYGLIVTSDGIYYEGVFNQDVLTGHGLMIFEDGTHYEGEFRAAGKFNGKGVLTLSSGDKIEGNLIGGWNEGIKISTGTLHVANNKTIITTKPKSFGIAESSIKNNAKVPDAQKIWQNVASLISKSRIETLMKGNKKIKKQMQREQLDLIPQFCREEITNEGVRELRLYLSKAFDSPHHPFGALLAEVTEAYTATYGGVRVHPLLLNHAVYELQSIIIRIYEIARLLFPALPPYGKEICLDDTSESDIISCAALLHPLLLPRVYSALFILYALHNKQEDCMYWKRLMEWNKQSDFTLLGFLTVDQKFWICQESKNNTQEAPYSPAKDQMFTKAIETLQQLKTTFSPFEKLLVIRQTFQNMTSTVQLLLGSDYRWNMDDLFPVFHFVVVRARILQLGSEIHFIEDFMEPNLQNGELGIMFTTLKACFYQILQEKSTINS